MSVLEHAVALVVHLVAIPVLTPLEKCDRIIVLEEVLQWTDTNGVLICPYIVFTRIEYDRST